MKIHVTLALALVSTSAAVRERDPGGIKSLRGVAICGNDDIFKDITSPTTVRAIKAIDWKGIDDTMMDYVDDHKSLVASRDRDIELLKEKIRQKKSTGHVTFNHGRRSAEIGRGVRGRRLRFWKQSCRNRNRLRKTWQEISE